jgi:nucleoside-diphosphate-sugar epimerase
MKDKILITGSTGFVGKHLVEKLLNEGHTIVEITRNKTKSSKLFGDRTSKIEVNDINFNNKIMEFDPNVVVHLASYLTSSDRWNDVEKLIESNILFLSKLLNTVSKLSLDLFINTGTFAEYFKGDDNYIPAYFYAATKTASRSILNYYSNTYSFKQATVVPYTIYGGNDSSKKIIDLIIESTESKEKLELSPGEQILDFIHIEDVASFYEHMIKHRDNIPDNSNFKLGTGTGYSLKQIASIIESVTNKKTNINWGGKKYRESDIMYAVADIEYINTILDWKPKIKLEDGLLNMVKLNTHK